MKLLVSEERDSACSEAVALKGALEISCQLTSQFGLDCRVSNKKLVNTCIREDDNPYGCQDCCHGSSSKHERSNHKPEAPDISDDPQNADESERPRH